MRIDVLTIFPEMFQGFLSLSMMKRAQERGLVSIDLHDIRRYATDKHGTVDDVPFGGGPGMVFKPEPVFSAVADVLKDRLRGKIILMSPQGERYHQGMARALTGEDRLLFICGHYKGLDERIMTLADQEISIGDYVLTGGELAAMVVIDSVVRLIPGVLGDEGSAASDSFSQGLLDAPYYTRPRVFRELSVPEILISGNHEHIRIWRRREALRQTLRRRPDLLTSMVLTEEDKDLLRQIHQDERKTEGSPYSVRTRPSE